MLYFRESELEKLNMFMDGHSRAMAIYGRRRTGKTELILEAMKQRTDGLYFQCSSYDYNTCLQDYKKTVSAMQSDLSEDSIFQGLNSFKDVFVYLCRSLTGKTFIIDEFPFLCRKSENTAAEFQWIIDHALAGAAESGTEPTSTNKIILLGSNMSFMQRQINDVESPLYGRFDEILEVRPFSFGQVHELFQDFAEAVDVYAQTGGVAQYVMFYKNYASVKQATKELYFDRNGRLFLEANNMLFQELRETTTYISILRAIGGSAKDSGQIAKKSGLDQRGIFSYLNKLVELNILTPIDNPLSKKQKDKKYIISDYLFRFSFTFIEPNISIISAIDGAAMDYVLGDKYSEYLGPIYEEIIQSACYNYAIDGRLPFMPTTVGRWWGNVKTDGEWTESEVDLIAYNDSDIIIGECKFRNRKVGVNELDLLKAKTPFIPVGTRRVHYLLASRKGFTDKLKSEEDVILIDKI